MKVIEQKQINEINEPPPDIKRLLFKFLLVVFLFLLCAVVQLVHSEPADKMPVTGMTMSKSSLLKI